MSVEPVVIKVKRYACPFCHRGRAKRDATVEHIERCWSNPANRTCKTCAFLRDVPRDRDGCEQGGPTCSCADGSITCEAGVDLKDGEDPESFPVVGCHLWEVADQ